MLSVFALGVVLVHSLALPQSQSTAPASSAQAPAGNAAPASAPASPALDPLARFDQTVSPVLTRTCSPCHNARVASGGVNLLDFTKAHTVHDQREAWETIVRQVRGGSMPPPGIPRPKSEVTDAFVKTIEEAFDQMDRNMTPDPGRVTARRLNRSEYTNTIRDLLGVEFRADRAFPTDDSGEGFDNIADVLTVSPLLMEKYLSAADRIATRALDLDKLPNPVEVEYTVRASNPPSNTGSIRRVNPSTIELTHRFDFDGEYDIRIGLPGDRGPEGKPVTMNVWVDGKLAESREVDTRPSGLVFFNPYSEEQLRLPVSEGEHVIRVAFVGDTFLETLPERYYYRSSKNKFPNSVTVVGPHPGKTEKASRRKILLCDPNSGAVCVEKIIHTLARRAYRRPVSRTEVAALLRFVDDAKANGQSVEHGIRTAIMAMLVSPHFLFRMERDPDPNDPSKIHRVSDVELASRLSYFLWRSMPDEELLRLAEANKLHEKAALRAQVARMIEDPRSASFAEDFAGQWLELRNLDSVKPDPDRYLYWGPELRSAMKAETRLFFEHMLRTNRPLSEFLNAKYTFLNDRLAAFYGIAGVEGSDFRKVELATDQRGGLLGQASILTISSYPSRTSVVIRGKYILQNILGAPPPPPPPDVPALEEDAVGSSASLRQQMEKHRANAICASCHAKMDPLGFGLENYDAIGKWRTMDGKFPIDSTGILPDGRKFSGPAQMREALLAQMPEFAQNVVEKMMIYAMGRGLQRYDRVVAKEITRKLAPTQYPFQQIVYEIVESLPFQSRRGEAAEPQNVATREQQAHPRIRPEEHAR
jgi:mono/diheme cytochrome c family protein